MATEERINFTRFLSTREFFEYSYPEVMPLPKHKILPEQSEGSEQMGTSDYLVAFSSSSHRYCVGCVDMVNSTKISANIPSHKLSGYYEIFLNSMAKIIGKFGGKVIKNVGDCLLYYFPECAESKRDGPIRCLDCGLAMLKVQPIICQQMTSKKLPCIRYRVSADCGYVLLMNTTDSSSVDLIGPPVNMCTKINHCAGQNEFVIGGDLYETVRKFSGYKFCQMPSYNVGFRQSYPVYRVGLF